MTKQDTKFYVVGDPDGAWFHKPVEAVDEVDAVVRVDEDALSHSAVESNYAYDVYEVVKKEPVQLKAAVRVVSR